MPVKSKATKAVKTTEADLAKAGKKAEKEIKKGGSALKAPDEVQLGRAGASGSAPGRWFALDLLSLGGQGSCSVLGRAHGG